jgi:WD40 repeat protein
MPRDSSMLLRITESEIEVKKLPELTLTRTIRRLGTRTDFAQMLPDGKSLLLSETQALGIYDLSPPEHTRILSPQASTRRREISRSGPLVILPSNVAEPIELWSNGEKKELSLLGKENRDLNQAQHEALSDDGRYLAISSSSFLSISVKLIDLRERKYLGTIPLGREQAARVLYHLAFSADSTKCLACTDRGVFILDVTGRKVLRQFSFPNQTLVNQVTAQFSPDGQQIAVTVLQSENVLEDLFKPSIWLLSVIDSTTGQVLQKGTEPFQGTLLGWSPDRKYLVTRFEEKTTLWNIATLRREVEIPGGIRAIDSFSPDGKLALLSRGNRLRIWDVARNELLLDFDPEVGPVRQAVFSPDGNLLRLVGDQRSVEIRVDAMNPYLEGNRTWHQERLKN